jgi:hypothetical protein
MSIQNLNTSNAFQVKTSILWLLHKSRQRYSQF